MEWTHAGLRLTGREDGAITIETPACPALRLGPLTPGVTADGARQRIASCARDDGWTETFAFAPSGLVLTRRWAAEGDAFALESALENRSARPVVLNDVSLLELAPDGAARFAAAPGDVRLYEQGSYWAHVRRLGVAHKAQRASGEEDAQAVAGHSSHFVALAYDAGAKHALRVGFETGERWIGQIETKGRPGEHPSGWAARFDGGDLRIAPGERIALESLSLQAGGDPLALLERYGDRVARRHGVQPPAETPVSWCSWYPYRLGVTQERALATAQIAAERLKPLGLRIIEIDLGWESGHLPSAFDENDQFPDGLKRLAERLEARGFALGVWKGPFSISGQDPLAQEHPEWLLGKTAEEGPHNLGDWFWEPHGATYALDLTHPGAQEWLRQKIRSLAARGVRYFKPDFIGGVLSGALKARHDPTVVAGGGCEAARIGMVIIQEELKAAAADALVLNCGCPDLPGKGAFPLLYACNDTGNTGYVGWKHLREDYGRNVAGHLFKQGRWGIIQPSCLCVGLPGTLEEARVRATATFLSGGQVDISDDLTTLPEDRWEVLEATLPPLGKAATPLDLFEPFSVSSLDYASLCQGGDGAATAPEGGEVSQVWKLSVEADWDRWDLLGLFHYAGQDQAEYGAAQITNFLLPLARLGLDPDAPCWVHEFWSGQFLGTSPFVRINPHGYRHPGDMQSLIRNPEPGAWEVSFFGPAAKLLVIRRARPHPWPVATRFHQSGGKELEGVSWDGACLRGTLRRPAGQQGAVVIADAGRGLPAAARVAGQEAIVRRGARGALSLPITTREDRTAWEVRW